jgi:signal peptidase I
VVLALAVAAVTIVAAVDRYGVHAVSVGSASMQPAIEPGDRLLVNRRTDPADLHLGDVVVVGGLPWGDGGELVKRVIGLPGDRVACCDASGRLRLNGIPLDEPWAYPGEPASTIPFDVLVPPERLWLLGDHRSVSDDSRHHLGDAGGGMVPFADVVGQVLVRYWPSQRLGQVGPSLTSSRGTGVDG